ncbi:hypothetical protein [Kitasatospora sp. NPDC008115]|uniref:hypothetical protein n=1 Tax=Kitasatospora sp. NPDC008115 TaxID=3364022 RepID=UPI0036E88FC1
MIGARRLAAGPAALCAALAAVAAGWTVDRGARTTGLRETDTDRAQRPASTTAGTPARAGTTCPRRPSWPGPRVAHLHYRIAGGADGNLDDSIRVHDLPGPGAPAPLPPDLAAALPGEEPAQGAPVPEPPGGRERRAFALDADTGSCGAADVCVRAVGRPRAPPGDAKGARRRPAGPFRVVGGVRLR